jgi:hypothetical protein
VTFLSQPNLRPGAKVMHVSFFRFVDNATFES